MWPAIPYSALACLAKKEEGKGRGRGRGGDALEKMRQGRATLRQTWEKPRLAGGGKKPAFVKLSRRKRPREGGVGEGQLSAPPST